MPQILREVLVEMPVNTLGSLQLYIAYSALLSEITHLNISNNVITQIRH